MICDQTKTNNALIEKTGDYSRMIFCVHSLSKTGTQYSLNTFFSKIISSEISENLNGDALCLYNDCVLK